MMMTNPENDMFAQLLAEYTAPLPDDGFSNRVVENLKTQQRYVQRVRRRILAGAVVLGGAIAATQVPAFVRLTKNFTAQSTAQISELSSLTSLPYGAPIIVGVFIFMLWALVDNRGSEVI